MEELSVKRFALDEKGELIEELVKYGRGVDGIEKVDPRYHALAGREGVWIAVSLANFLGDISTYDPKQPVESHALRSGLTPATEETAVAKRAEREQQIKTFNQTLART